MTAPLTFGGLRELAITSAQRASGKIWTDYNAHDPGVTLLEAVSYALTELDYRSEFPLADLLANEEGALDLQRLGLHPPREALLQLRPVTTVDLALALAKECPDVERVLVYPGTRTSDGDRRGLYDLHFVRSPGSEATDQALQAQVRAAFHKMRNLCEDIGNLSPATALRCRLEAEVEVHRRQSPERTAALVYHCCTQMMIEGALIDQRGSISRQDVLNWPERQFGNDGRNRDGADSINLFFMAVSGLDEVAGITSLSFRSELTNRSIFEQNLGHGQYRLPVVPEKGEDEGLVLRSRGLAVPFDNDGMHKELLRLRSEYRAQRLMRHDEAEWDTPPASRARKLVRDRIGALLPSAYCVGDDLPPPGTDPRTRAAALQLRGYLGLVDSPLADATADLAALPDLFSVGLSPKRSYSFTPFDFGAAPELAVLPPGNRDVLAADFDPWHDRKGRVLNHLLALYSEAFSQNSLKMHDLSRGVLERRDRVLEGRALLLDEVASLAADRAAGADFTTSQTSDSVGIGRKLSILLGFSEKGQAGLATALTCSGLDVVTGEAIVPRIARNRLQPSDDPLDAFVPRQDGALETGADVDLANSRLVLGKQIEAAVFRRAALIGAYALAREEQHDGRWTLFLDPAEPSAEAAQPDAGLVRCGHFANRTDAIAQANRLSRQFAELNRASEGLCLVEDVLLRGSTNSFSPLSLWVVMSGWSLRTANPDFRSLAEETVRLLCPAHLLQLQQKVIWLDPAGAASFDKLHRAWQIGFRNAAREADQEGTQPSGSGAGALDRASADLRGFLLGQVSP